MSGRLVGPVYTTSILRNGLKCLGEVPEDRQTTENRPRKRAKRRQQILRPDDVGLHAAPSGR
jgi:hypothetical protein